MNQFRTSYHSILTASLVMGISLWSCNNASQNGESGDAIKRFNVTTDAELHDRMLAEIDSLEQIVYTFEERELREEHRQLRGMYDRFAELFKGDLDKSPEYLFKAGALSRSLGEPVEAIKRYEALHRIFPNDERAPEALFLKAFTYDEDMNHKELAREAYGEVVRAFPGDHWANQAQQRLETLDMTDEELIEYFIKQQQP